MAISWRNYLAVLGLCFVVVLAACGEDSVAIDIDDEDQDNDPTENIDNNDQPSQNAPAGACQDDDDCIGDNYCHQESCVSRQFICSLQGCAGARGVCDPSAGIDGDCVNAETCTAETDCLEDYLCITGECIPEADACAECTSGEECVFNHNSLTVTCEVPYAVCEPGHRECEGDILHVCNSLGTSQQSYQCNMGCDPDTLRCEQPAGSNCSNPIVAEHGDILEFQWSEFSNDYDPEPGTGCVDSSTNLRTRGGDVTLELEVEPGQTGVVELFTAVDYAVIYVLESCETGASSCIAPDGFRNEPVHNEHVRAVSFFNESDETKIFHVVADSGTGAALQTAYIQVGITDQVCQPGEPVCADSELGVCNPYGTGYETNPNLPCELGCADLNDATIAQCESHPHAYCHDAIVYEGNGMESFSYNIIDFDNTGSLNPTSCDDRAGQSGTFAGPTAYFEVEMQDKQRLNANLASVFEAGIWISSGCDDGDCLWASNTSSSTEMTSYIADGDQTVYVVVQAVDADVEIGQFTLDLSVDDPLCDGFIEGDVLGCEDETVVAYCTGIDYASYYACDEGCEDDQCIDPSGDHCLEAIALDNIDTFSGSFATHSNYLAPTSCSDGDSFSTPNGPEYIFQIETDDYQLVQVDLQTNSTSAGFYLLDSCPVSTTNVSDQCVYGHLPSGQTDFFLDDGGTYYLVVDSSNANDNASFTLDLHISDGVCLPGDSRCTGNIIEQCDQHGDGYEQIASCLEGCDEDNVVCTAPSEAKTRCVDPYVISQSGQFVDNFSRFDQDQNLRSEECFDDGTSGPDIFYRVHLEAEQGVIVTATADVGSGHLAGLYMTENECPNAAIDPDDACLDAVPFHADGSSQGVLEYYTAQGGTYLVSLAAVTDFSSGEFTIDFDFFDGECDPATDNFCVSQELAERCTTSGEIKQFDCDYGCHDGYCLPKQGNSCERPFDIDEEAQVDGDGTLTFIHSHTLTGTAYTDDFNPYADGSSCTGWYGDGPDIVYAFEGWKGDELTVEFGTEYDGAIWITNDCSSSAAQACFEGTDTVFGPGTEVLEFTVPQRSTYYIIADAVQSGATGSFDTNITIEPGPRVDDPEFLIQDQDTLSWEMEWYDTETGSFQIGNGGEFPLEYEIISGESFVEFDPSTGSIDGGQWSTIDVTATCPDNRGTNVNVVFEITTNDLENDSQTYLVQLVCNPPPPGSLTVTVDGLPDGVAHIINIVDEDDDVVDTVPQDGEVEELFFGDYTLVPQTVTDDGDEYSAEPVAITIDPDTNTTATVVYSLVEDDNGDDD